ncbi:uncharacterized protein LOC129310810 [Prosopis cineraria]|uniref:uncharacterized protein LOC129310810 n=1 Tax=Prosopis cineraria TaxID=364024 RepID=UPI00240ECDC7|nr:uncharacterized protein LOC129310810 [Prosopis cineraria]
MKRDVQQYVASCEVCQKNKYQALTPAGLLQPLTVPQSVWEDISMDFITELPKSKRYDTILVVVDRLTKYAHFFPLAHPFSVKDVAEKFVAEVVKLHGFPKIIVSDRDRVFISHFWQELFKQAGTQLCLTSSYHPESDGQTKIIEQLWENLAKAQSKMKVQADKHRRDVHFEVGDLVYVKLRPYRLKTLARRDNEKLSPRFYGPFKVLEKIGTVAYKLELLPTARIHPVFHVSQPKQTVSAAVVQPSIPPILSNEFELQVQPQDIRKVRKLMNRQREFPTFSLEDKMKLLGEGNDGAHYFPKTYQRKSKGRNNSSGNTLTDPRTYLSGRKEHGGGEENGVVRRDWPLECQW